MLMIPAMAVKAVARLVGEHDTRLWRVVHHYVDAGRARIDASDATRVAIDETAARRGHDYITLFVDIEQARVLFATEGRDARTVAALPTFRDRRDSDSAPAMLALRLGRRYRRPCRTWR
jgi:transposase